jgi:hypothetical protein
MSDEMTIRKSRLQSVRRSMTAPLTFVDPLIVGTLGTFLSFKGYVRRA